MSRENVEGVIRRFGSQQRVAELLGIWQTAVSGWVRRGAIPARRQQELLAAARREGVELGPADFFGIADEPERAEPERADGTNGGAVPVPRHAGHARTNASSHEGSYRAMSTAAATQAAAAAAATTAEVIELKAPA
jgi:transcriptional regulator with XRE-family HTH domain